MSEYPDFRPGVAYLEPPLPDREFFLLLLRRHLTDGVPQQVGDQLPERHPFVRLDLEQEGGGLALGCPLL